MALQVSVLAAIISAAGMLSMAVFGDFGQRFSPYISAFAVGVLITTTIFHLIPEGYSYSPAVWQWITFGFLSFLGAGLFLQILTSGKSLNTDLAFASSSILALGVHSFMDGILYATAFQGAVTSGWTTVLGLLVHELPEGIIIFYLLREARLNIFAATIIAFITAGLTTVAGTITALTFIEQTTSSLHIMMGITAGAFIYLMIFHLGPHASTAPDRRGYLAASIGVIVSTITILISHH